MADTDILQEICYGKLPVLRNLFRNNWPSNMHVFYFIDTCIQWKKNWPKENYVTLYCPNGNFDDGTFIAVITTECYDVFLYTLDPSLKSLEKSLRETKRIDYNQKPLFAAVHQDFFDMVVKVRKEIGHPVPNDVPSHVWWLPKENALKYEYSIPEEIYVAPLNESHVRTMNAVWPHGSPSTEKYLAKILELNGGFGLFLQSNHELCAWVLKNYFGGLGVLQTAAQHKRKGYGTLVTKIFSKFLAEHDEYDLSGFIVKINSASQNMFAKLGYEPIIPVTWCEF